MSTWLYNMFPLSGESLILKLWLEILHQSKTNESSRVLVFVMIVRAPATPLCEKIRDCVLRYDWFTDFGAWWTWVAPRNFWNHTPPEAGSKASS